MAEPGPAASPDPVPDGLVPDEPAPGEPVPDGLIPDEPVPDGLLPDEPLPDGPEPDGSVLPGELPPEDTVSEADPVLPPGPALAPGPVFCPGVNESALLDSDPGDVFPVLPGVRPPALPELSGTSAPPGPRLPDSPGLVSDGLLCFCRIFACS